MSNIVNLVSWRKLFEIDVSSISNQNNDNSSVIKVLKIPSYQRTYVWDANSILYLLNRIAAAMNSKKKTYDLGYIVLCNEEKSSITGNFFIVDGQQRITSLTIIVSLIRHLARDNTNIKSKCDQFLDNDRTQWSDEKKFKLCVPNIEKNNYGTEFRKFIQNGKIDELIKFDGKCPNRIICEYIKRLKANYCKIYDDLSGKNEEFLDNLISYVNDSCEFTVKIINDFLEAHDTFCSLNTTSIQVTAIELLKGRFYGQLIYDRGLTEANRTINLKFNKFWSNIETELDKEELTYFLVHICRFKLIEKQNKANFIACFSYNNEQILTMFLKECFVADEASFNQLQIMFEIWCRIFRSTSNETFLSRESLKLLNSKSKEWDIWITMALTSAYKNINLNKQFWTKLEKYIVVMMSCSGDLDIYSYFYKDLMTINERKGFNVDSVILDEFVKNIKGHVCLNFSDEFLVYVMARINMEARNAVLCNYSDIKKAKYDFLCPLDIQTGWDRNLFMYSGFIGNLFLFDSDYQDKFKNKNWTDKKKNIEFANTYPYSHEVLDETEWNMNCFKKFQEKYLKQLGKILDIDEMKSYTMSIDITNSIVEQLKNTEFFKETDCEQRVENQSSDFKIQRAGEKLKKYIVGVTSCNEEDEAKIINAVCLIADSNGSIQERQEFVKFLVHLRKKYKIFKGKHEKTFNSWFLEFNGNIPNLLYSNDPCCEDNERKRR